MSSRKVEKIEPIILAIDTSCDDTSVAIVRGEVVLVNIVASQVDLHKQYGGVFPTVAKQAHRENIDPTVKHALKRAGLKMKDITAIGVTVGPGLAPSLEVGINKAKDLAIEFKKPFIAVNHIEGHLLSPLAKRNSISKKAENKNKQSDDIDPKRAAKIKFPVLGVVVSGGHTDFVLIKNFGNYERIGFSIDDAAGECLDKIGRMVYLGYPAGSVIEEFAKKGDENRFKFPLPMTQSKDYNLSFSGLKTFARNLVIKLKQEATIEGKQGLDKQTIYDICASAQHGVFRHILHKLEKVLENENIKELWLGGGVAANVTLRKILRFKANQYGIKFKAPYSSKLCGDNAAMIGLVAAKKFERGDFIIKPADLGKIDRNPKWRVGEKDN
ncbi:MAG: tRNA (adenosine(37)-N6)-threonylcarbamoyltransferase complex transferase subunit TsaD [Candidatus Pacebacteria bacterium]|nr:tRNA (adenosine(37)-N6)-threonylcarbamoyltransferase complex transferase subunit TsaD [Candidatus Paceibacterota bacterium]